MRALTICARLLAMLALVLTITRGTARADSVDELIKQLENDDSDKVRLSAALNLAKLGDQKAILALAKAVNTDSDKNVRGAAAAGLGKLVTDKTKPSFKSLAISSLKKAAADDESDFVKTQASKALAAIGVGGT